MSADLTPVERAAVALLEQQSELDLLAEHIEEKRRRPSPQERTPVPARGGAA